MNRIFLVRHAESQANTQGVYQGQTYDTQLSPLGFLQAKALAGYLEPIRFDNIYVSPLIRTLQTIDLIVKKQNTSPVLDRRILETNHGRWEGRTKVEIARFWPGIYQSWLNFPSRTAFPGGERFLETQIRVLRFWQEISAKEGNTLVVTHDNIIRVILAKIHNLDLDQIWKFELHPASVTVFEENHIKLHNHTGHLTGLMANLSLHAL
jgi:probable phosphoglycerate mutase